MTFRPVLPPNLPPPSSGGGSGGSSGSGGGAAGSGSGGGSSSGGGSNPTPAVPGPGQGGARMLGSQMFQVVRLAADRTEYGPTLFVNANDEVEITPLRTNVANCFVATSGNSDAKFPPRWILLPTDNPISVSVQSLKEIGVYSGTPGEGVLIVLKRRP